MRAVTLSMPIFCFAALLLGAAVAASAGEPLRKPTDPVFGPLECDQRNAYCGINSLYAAAKLEGLEVEYQELVRSNTSGERLGVPCRSL